MTTPVLLSTGADGIARLRLNRPDASNGLNVEILRALHEAILACHADPTVKVVLLTGAGRNFCAGGDIKTFESKGEALPEYLREATAWLTQNPVWLLILDHVDDPELELVPQDSVVIEVTDDGVGMTPEVQQRAFEPYFTDAFLETTTDPNLVHDLAAKLDTAAIYTQAEINQCAEAFVKGKGNSALIGAVGPGQKRFAERYTAALIDNGGEGDKGALAELDMFRKDIGSFIRLYDFMSQIINYGDPELEKKQIYLRLLDRVIQSENYTAPIDLSDVVLKQVKQIDKGRVDIGLGAKIGLSGVTAAGSGEKRDPKMIAFQQVLDRLNDLFGSEDFTQSQKVSFLEALLRTLLEDHALVQQAKVNSAKQFVESPDFDDAVTGAVADNQGAHEKMSDYFFTNAPGRTHLIADIAKWFYQVVSAEYEQTEASVTGAGQIVGGSK